MKYLSTFFLLLTIISCQKVKQSTKDVLQEGTAVLEKTANQVFEQVENDGLSGDKSYYLWITDTLRDKGLVVGKQKIVETDTGDIISIYLIFNQDFSENILTTIHDKSGAEYARFSLLVEGKANEARFVNFTSQESLHIERQSKVVLQL